MFQNRHAPPIGFLHGQPSVTGDVAPPPRPRRLPRPRRIGKTRIRVLPSRIHEKGLPGFLRWLERDFPAAHAALAKQRPELLRAAETGLGQAILAPPVTRTAGQQITDFVMPLLQVYQQQQILRLQLKRAKAGLAPLELEQYAVPPARFELEAGEKTQRTGLLIAGALGLGAVAYFLTQRRARA